MFTIFIVFTYKWVFSKITSLLLKWILARMGFWCFILSDKIEVDFVVDILEVF